MRPNTVGAASVSEHSESSADPPERKETKWASVWAEVRRVKSQPAVAGGSDVTTRSIRKGRSARLESRGQADGMRPRGQSSHYQDRGGRDNTQTTAVDGDAADEAEEETEEDAKARVAGRIADMKGK